jgi:hypothetical protein
VLVVLAPALGKEVAVVAAEFLHQVQMVLHRPVVLVETDFVSFGGLYNESFSNQKRNCC